MKGMIVFKNTSCLSSTQTSIWPAKSTSSSHKCKREILWNLSKCEKMQEVISDGLFVLIPPHNPIFLGWGVSLFSSVLVRAAIKTWRAEAQKWSRPKVLFEVMPLKREKAQASSERRRPERLGFSLFQKVFKGRRGHKLVRWSQDVYLCWWEILSLLSCIISALGNCAE